jgi:hypothetical protein
VLTAEVDGEISVAISLVDLHTVADPFRFTTEVQSVALARAQQLRAAALARGGRRWTLGTRPKVRLRSARA